MSSNSNTKKKNETESGTQIYGFKIIDNGSKWGSNAIRNPDGSFEFDEEMKKNRPDDWNKMIEERVEYLHDRANKPYKIPKKWAGGRTRPL
jgi:hypothetical protein